VYALMYAKLGGNVVVNDVSEKGARGVVEEIVKGVSLSSLLLYE
jgi:multifunctional beta-oxidation protein